MPDSIESGHLAAFSLPTHPNPMDFAISIFGRTALRIKTCDAIIKETGDLPIGSGNLIIIIIMIRIIIRIMIRFAPGAYPLSV